MSSESDGGVALSVVVCVRGGERTIGQCLERILESDLGDDELIVVDDGSRDRTREIVAGFGVRLIHHAESVGASAARNAGARAATGAILVFVDSDVLIPRRSRQTITNVLWRDRSAHVVQGYYDTEHPHTGAASLYKNTWISHSFEVNGPGATSLFSCFLAIGRDDFWAAGGYDQSRQSSDGTDDFEFGLRLVRQGYRIRREKALKTVHLKHFTWASLLENQFRRSRGLTRLHLTEGAGWQVARRLRMGNIGPTFISRIMLAPLLVFATVPAAMGYPLPLAICICGELGLSASFLAFSARKLRSPLVVAFVPIGYTDVLVSSLGVVMGIADAARMFVFGTSIVPSR